MKEIRKQFKRKYLSISVLILCSGIGALQFTDSPLEEKPVLEEINAPLEVVAILKRSCYNCHSNEIKLAWYDIIAPVSWKVNADVERAREVMNFSEWGNLTEAQHKGKMWAIYNMVEAGKMPLKNYSLFHPDSKVTEYDIETLRNYVHEITIDPPADQAKSDADQEFEKWRQSKSPLKKTPVSLNGVAYSEEFKRWDVISMSMLYDNSIRTIYGNEIAVKAIEEENFHPWPDGAVVVKAVWEQVGNDSGEVRPGKFLNAQFMVKDAKKYKDTEGWGFAKFSTQELIPFGKTVTFASKSCISCHRQRAEETGYVFNVPLKVNH